MAASWPEAIRHSTRDTKIHRSLEPGSEVSGVLCNSELYMLLCYLMSEKPGRSQTEKTTSTVSDPALRRKVRSYDPASAICCCVNEVVLSKCVCYLSQLRIG
jgi:hypothetical protein